jgi:hypothetical protein
MPLKRRSRPRLAILSLTSARRAIRLSLRRPYSGTFCSSHHTPKGLLLGHNSGRSMADCHVRYPRVFRLQSEELWRLFHLVRHDSDCSALDLCVRIYGSGKNGVVFLARQEAWKS